MPSVPTVGEGSRDAPRVDRWLSDRLSGKYVALFGFVALTVGVAWLAVLIHTGVNVWLLVPPLVVSGLGIGCVFSPLANLATGTVEPRQMGAASGIFDTTRQVGGVLGSAAIGVLLQARLTVSIHNVAVTASGQLPAPFRPAFVEGMAKAAGSATSAAAGGGTGCQLPPGVPASAAAKVCSLGAQVFDQGFTDAAKATLILPAIVLALGAVACVAMARRPRRPVQDMAPSSRPVPEPA